MAKVGYMADNFGEFPHTMRVTADNIMWKSGLNVGNFAFWNATQLLLDEEIVLFPFGAKSDNYIGKLDFIVIPAANWLSVGQDFGWLATFIEEVDVPCLVFGLGAQSENVDEFPTLEEGTLNLLKAISKRSPYLAVRGDYTKELCVSLDIKNVEAMGCPSILTSANKALGETVTEKWLRTADKIAIHGLNLKHNTQDVERYLYDLLKEIKGSSYVIQEPRSMIRLMTQEGLKDIDMQPLAHAHEYLSQTDTFEDFVGIIRGSSYVPFSLNSWANYLSYHSHAVGTRIHGSIISLTAEIPSICVPHDARTRELCDIMKIPAINAAEYNTDESVEDLFSHVAIDAEEFDENRRVLARKNAEMIKQSGMKISAHLNAFL